MLQRSLNRKAAADLMPVDSSKWLQSPEICALLSAIDIGVDQALPDGNGYVQIPIASLLAGCNNFVTLVMTLSMLPPGFAELVGEAQKGEASLSSEGEAVIPLLDYMASRETVDGLPLDRMLCRVNVAFLDVGRVSPGDCHRLQ